MDVENVMPEPDMNKECRGLGITENAVVDTCLNEGANWPFMADYEGDCALKPVEFSQ